jgi:LuxR family maltose regulon positive regulatory protein
VKNYIALKKYSQALTVLCNSHPRDPQNKFLFGELIIALLTAVARIKTNDTSGAMEDFKRAYSLSFNGVFEMPFVELGKELHPLITAASKQVNCNIPQEWLKKINRKASIYAKKVAVIRDSYKRDNNIEDSIELSEREREVLTDLHHGLSREEIAVNRYISINTVKKILQSLYLKLDASNNVDAVRIALDKKLIY